MDALALLNALDVIRNEETYQKRLNAIAEAQAVLDTSEYIVDTVEVANARLDEANRLLDKHRQMMENADKVIEELKKERLSDVEKKLEDLANQEQKLVLKNKELDKQRLVLQDLEYKTDKTRQQLAYSVADYDQRRVEAQQTVELYNAKVDKLRDIIGR